MSFNRFTKVSDTIENSSVKPAQWWERAPSPKDTFNSDPDLNYSPYPSQTPLLSVRGKFFSQLSSWSKYLLEAGKGKLFLFLQFLLLLWLIGGLVEKFHFTDNDDSRFQHLRNDICQPSGSFHYDAQRSQNWEQDKDLCVLPASQQYKQFVWLFVDSLAVDQASNILQMFPTNRNFHRIMNHGFKFSTAIYTSFFTGKIPTNYAGLPIQSDTIFSQMRYAGMRMKYIGPSFPTLTLLGAQAAHFEQVVSLPSESRLFDYFQRAQSTSFMSDLNKKSMSLMVTTNYLDERIHKTGKEDPANQKLIKDVEPLILQLKQWIDEHPDYLLIINSDHGGSPNGGKHEGELHGASTGGNEGFILFYNPNLKAHRSQGDWLDAVDVCGTISGYFRGVGIPMESVGIATPSGDDLVHQWKVRTANAKQIKKLADLKGFSYNERLFQDALTNKNKAEAVKDLTVFINSIKEPLMNFKRFPRGSLIFTSLLIIIYQVAFMKGAYNNWWGLLKTFKTNIVAVVLPLMYSFFDLLFLQFDYFTNFPTIFAMYSTVLGAAAMHSFQRLSLVVKDIDHELTFAQSVDNEKDSFLTSSRSSSSPNRASYRISFVIFLRGLLSFYWTFVPFEVPFLSAVNYLGLAAFILYEPSKTFCASWRYRPLAELLRTVSFKRKETIYLVLLLLVRVYEWNESLALMQVIYFVLFVHAVKSLMVSPRQVILPATLLLFILSLEEERFFLIFVVTPSFFLLTEAFEELPQSFKVEKKYSTIQQQSHLLFFLFFLNLVFDYYVLMDGGFDMNVAVRAGTIGVLNSEDSPTLAAFLMAYHKLGYFFIFTSYFCRIVASEREKYANYSRSGLASVAPLHHTSSISLLGKFLTVKTLVLMWAFHLSFWLYKDYLTCFIMTMITALVTVLIEGVTLIDRAHEFLIPLLRKLPVYWKYLQVMDTTV